jgi:hypothetical protein
MRIWDPGWKKFGSGMEKDGSGIRSKHPGFATLQETNIQLIAKGKKYIFKPRKIGPKAF